MRFQLVLLVIFWYAVASSQARLTVAVGNELDFDRIEIVAIKTSALINFLSDKKQQDIRISNGKNYLVTQWIDYDLDGKADELLFQAHVKANSESRYYVVSDSKKPTPTPTITTFSRFAPERTDDYAWENDKVAFRTYGPDAQKRAENKLPNGTLSSGIDLWLKRTDKPVIDKWYAGYKTDGNFYHKDRGEGYDPYHVGSSRGTGGTGVWVKDSLEVSKNFIAYKTIAVGPLRTVFELEYAPYGQFGISETKRISLDLGSNFSKFEVKYQSETDIPNYTVGLTLHDGKGQIETKPQYDWFRYAETIDGAWLAEGLIVKTKYSNTSIVLKSGIPDKDHILVLMNQNAPIVFYAGFAWEKSGQVKNLAQWDNLLGQTSQALDFPFRVLIIP